MELFWINFFFFCFINYFNMKSIQLMSTSCFNQFQKFAFKRALEASRAFVLMGMSTMLTRNEFVIGFLIESRRS